MKTYLPVVVVLINSIGCRNAGRHLMFVKCRFLDYDIAQYVEKLESAKATRNHNTKVITAISYIYCTKRLANKYTCCNIQI